ncbi:MAG TPA: hypothetical protein VHE30_23080 [Polyangiaceae bacterium]|nr:hypothetical protein [Polyangiaceae bacterium]
MGRPLATFLSGAVLLACQSEATKHCHAVMSTAQEIVKNVDSHDLGSVERSLASVEEAIAACDKAGRTSEVDALTRAKNELSGHLEFMKKKALTPKHPKISPEDLASFQAHGDPNCPKGQAYKPDGNPNAKEIRCTGSQIGDLSLDGAFQYFDRRGFKLTKTDSPPGLRAEYGAELYVFSYEAATDAHPKCLTLYPAPGIPFQEAVARVTGTPMKKIERSGTIPTDRGKVPIYVDESETKLVIYLGDCGKGPSPGGPSP